LNTLPLSLWSSSILSDHLPNTHIGIDAAAQKIVAIFPDRILQLTVAEAEALAAVLFRLAQSLKEMQEEGGKSNPS
jgi:hypothetical protein